MMIQNSSIKHDSSFLLYHIIEKMQRIFLGVADANCLVDEPFPVPLPERRGRTAEPIFPGHGRTNVTGPAAGHTL